MNGLQQIATHYDAVIVGARCAGASTAMLLARSGMRVLVVDRQAYGTDTTSTHAMMRAGVLQLARWGILDKLVAAGTPKIASTTFHYGSEAFPIAIKPEHGVEHLVAPRRTVLDALLVDAAADAGAVIRHGVSLAGLQTGAGERVTGVELQDAEGRHKTVRAGIVIGADGRQSTVAGLAGAETLVQGRHATGAVYGYFEGLPNDGFHWYFEEGTGAGLIPTNDGRTLVFTGVASTRFAATFRDGLYPAFLKVAGANAPELRQQVEGATLDGRLRIFAGAPGFMRRCHGPGWALVGDAGYFKDPLTAHGMTDALRDAELLARAVIAGGPDALAWYQHERDALSRPLFDVTEEIATFGWDLEKIKQLHHVLSKSMKAETDHLAGLHDVEPLAA